MLHESIKHNDNYYLLLISGLEVVKMTDYRYGKDKFAKMQRSFKYTCST